MFQIYWGLQKKAIEYFQILDQTVAKKFHTCIFIYLQEKKSERWLFKMKKVQRYFLDYEFSKNNKSLEIKNENSFKIILNDKKNYEINKFFYKQIGKDHFWRDRLVWTDKQWLKYSSNQLLETWILKDNNNDLIKFAQTIETVCIECVENGAMTKDLAILVGPSSKYLTTNQFLDEIDGNLKKKLN